ncbi:MAG TPA: hypothetical protein VNS62_14140, partial [Candidatus Udaeobacter sp.]|nr:hypothetical protein [Candidatus Udaeobacter sp.]
MQGFEAFDCRDGQREIASGFSLKKFGVSPKRKRAAKFRGPVYASAERNLLLATVHITAPEHIASPQYIRSPEDVAAP